MAMTVDLPTQTTLPWLLSVCMALALCLFALFFQDEDDGRGANDPVELARRKRRKKGKGIFLQLFGGAVVALGKIIATLPLKRSRDALQKKLTQAGFPGGLSADEFQASKIIAIGLGGAAGAFIDNELDVAPMFLLVLSFIGFLYPGLWLNGLIQKRRRRVFRDLPDMLDILRLSTDAGLDLNSAMAVTVEKSRQGPLLDELEQVEREVSLGRTRKEAFRNFADRIAMTEINAFVIALIQAEQLGASIGPVLKTQSEMARTRRWQLAEVLVNKMPMKMLGPLVVFIFPSSFIILFTPLLIQWLQQK